MTSIRRGPTGRSPSWFFHGASARFSGISRRRSRGLRDRLLLVIVLYILVPSAWLAMVFFGLTVCHLAALGDDSHAVAVADWIATSDLAYQAVAPDRAAELLSFDPQGASLDGPITTSAALAESRSRRSAL
jgi:hypothetical protein